MSDRSRNWLKFGGLVSLAFVLGLLFAGLLDLPRNTEAQRGTQTEATPAQARPATRGLPAARPLIELSDAFAAVAEAVRPSVVYVTSRRTETVADRRLPPGFDQYFRQGPPRIEQGSGSGVIVSADGYILTNSHVVEGADKVEVQLLDRRSFTAKVVGNDPLTDIAVVKIDATSLPAAMLGESARARVGEWVLAVGNPLGNQLQFTVTSGIISAKGRGRLALPNSGNGAAIQDFIQTDAAINPGNSGGPLLNVRGEVIGINSAIASQTGTYVGYGFAIPIDLARRVMDQIIATGKVQRAALGVQVRDADAEDAAYVGMPEIRGVTVQDFTGDDSPAKRAGIEPGDILVTVDGEPVEYTAQLQQVVGFRRPGEVVKVEVARKGGVRKTFSVKLTPQRAGTELARADEPTGETAPGSGASIQSLGVTVEPVTPELTERFDLQPNFRGLLVREVSPDGPADGRLFGMDGPSPDIITAVEGLPVRTEAELRTALRSMRPGDVVSLQVYNPDSNAGQGGRRIVRVRLGR
jgi:serine protease Do